MASANEHCAQARLPPRFDVCDGVSDQPGTLSPNPQIPARCIDQPGLRFAAVTRDLQFAYFARKTFVWMVRAHIDAIQVGSTFTEQGFKASVNLP